MPSRASVFRFFPKPVAKRVSGPTVPRVEFSVGVCVATGSRDSFLPGCVGTSSWEELSERRKQKSVLEVVKD